MAYNYFGGGNDFYPPSMPPGMQYTGGNLGTNNPAGGYGGASGGFMPQYPNVPKYNGPVVDPLGSSGVMGGFMPQPKPYAPPTNMGGMGQTGLWNPNNPAAGTFGGGGLMDALRRQQMGNAGGGLGFLPAILQPGGGGNFAGDRGFPGYTDANGVFRNYPTPGNMGPPQAPNYGALRGLLGQMMGGGGAASLNPNTNPWAMSNANARGYSGGQTAPAMPGRMAPPGGFGGPVQAPGGFGGGRMYAGGSPSFRENQGAPTSSFAGLYGRGMRY